MFVRNANSVSGHARVCAVPAPPSHISAVCSDVAAAPGWGDSVIDGGIDAGRGEMKRCAHVALHCPAGS